MLVKVTRRMSMDNEAVFEAFDSVPRPHSSEIISQAYDREEAEFSKLLAKMTSRGVPGWFWKKYWHEIALLKENAAHYYLPSILVSAAKELDQQDSELKVVDALVKLLYVPACSNEHRRLSLRSRMTDTQVKVVIKVLERLKPIASLNDDYMSVLQQWR